MAKFIVKYRYWFLGLFTLLMIGSVVAGAYVKTNYEMAKYLSSDMPSVQALNIMEEEFGLPTNVRIMVEDVTMQEAVAIKNKIYNLPEVDTISWLDDAENIYTPIEFMDAELLKSYYHNGNACYYVYFKTSDFSANTGVALDQIRDIIGDKGYIYGTASSSQQIVTSTESSIGKLILIFIPILLIILIIATTSWIEPLLFFIALGYAIALNTGTNIIFGDISFVTHSMSAALQLAISMDYSIFLLHRFAEERALGMEPKEAMVQAIQKSFKTIFASAITTIAGFSALLFMKFTIGTDLGRVFAKGIVFSLLTTIFVLPALMLLFSTLLEKTRHRRFIPSLKGVGRLVYKIRFFAVALLLIVIVPSFLGQQNNAFIYGGSGISEQKGTPTYIAKEKIEEEFGAFNPVILLIPKTSLADEQGLTEALQRYPLISEVQGLSTLVDEKLPEELLPPILTEQFVSEHYRRMIIGLNTPEESERTFEAVEWIKNKAAQYYGDQFHLAGYSVSLYDVRSIAPRDNFIVNMVAVGAVGLVVLLSFRSILIPIVLVLSIETAVFMNMAMPYFFGHTIIFVGMLIVSALLLGATIDYAILLTSRFRERRQVMPGKQALIEAVNDAGGSILTSGLVLTSSGFAIMATSKVVTIREMGELIGRGALMSVVVVLFILPAVLYFNDKVITSFHKARARRKNSKKDFKREG